MLDLTSLAVQNITNTTGVVSFVQAYAYSLPKLIMNGDITAITVSFFAFFASLVIINKITSALLAIIKRIIFFVITGLAFYFFATEFYTRLSLMGPTTQTIIFGIGGLLIGIVGLILSFYWVARDVKKEFRGMRPQMEGDVEGIEEKAEIKKEDLVGPERSLIAEFKELKNELSLRMIRQDKNLLAVLVYLIIAEFGVFSSKTIAAPRPEVGLVFFGIFLVGALIFIRQVYRNIKVGLFHFAAALILGSALSLILGHFWGNIPFEILLSLEYFGTDSLVALITGIAISLFMGSK